MKRSRNWLPKYDRKAGTNSWYTFSLTDGETFFFAAFWVVVGAAIAYAKMPAAQECVAAKSPKALEMKFRTQNGLFTVECLDVADQESCKLKTESAAGETSRL